MSLENSTPGPWEAKPNGSGNWIIKSDDYGIVVHRSYYPDGMTPATAEADARLIAAAPDLYEALKNLTAKCVEDFGDGKGGDLPDWPDEETVCDSKTALTFGDIRRAQAALAKAEGRE